ncbi:MAG: haloalkane dehalogenase [Acidobacteriota bacterium]
MAVIRTPDERFEKLPDFPFSPHYIEINNLRVHYLDEGSGETILCLHGEPSWSYLYRKMLPLLSARHRVIAMDFIGFGRSDKFTERDQYTFQMHYNTLAGFITTLKLSQITLVVHDWGGLIGLNLAGNQPDYFTRLVIMNTGLPTGDEPIGEAFLKWRAFSQKTNDLPVGQVIRMSAAHADNISDNVVAAYDAPFPDPAYKAGALAWPLLVPIAPDDPVAGAMRQTRKALSRWDKPALVMFSDQDPITRGGDRFFRSLIPTAKAQPEIVIEDAGHFLQEEKGEEIAQHILEFITRAPRQ